MGNVFKLKAIKNKSNGQYTFSIPKKKLTSELKNIMEKFPDKKIRLQLGE